MKLCIFFFIGIGYASLVIVALLNIYYIVILAWSIFYLLQSFTSQLPWALCGQYWNTDCCVSNFLTDLVYQNYTEDAMLNGTVIPAISNSTNETVIEPLGYYINFTKCNGSFTRPETEYWE